MIKNLIVILIVGFWLSTIAYAETIDESRLCDSIRRAENGTEVNPRFPYGVKSVPCIGEADCRAVCLNSVKNNLVRYEKAGKPKPFIEFMGDRWCPVNGDNSGLNRFWVKNVNYYYNKEKVAINAN